MVAIAICKIIKSTFTDNKWNKHFQNNYEKLMKKIKGL